MEHHMTAVTLTKVQPEKLVAIAQKVGLTILAQPSQWKVLDSTGTRRFYIPHQKLVHKVELSGWSHELAIPWDAHYPTKKAPSPKITHIVDFSQPEKLILRDFYKMAKALVDSSVPVPQEEPASPQAPAEEPLVADSGLSIAASS
jgi:hypothetical protein